MITALQPNSISTNAYINFITNIAPVCGANMSIAPSTGYALSTYFDFSISSCTDPDLDLPLLYRFRITTENFESYIMCSSNQFNSITSKMFQGDLMGYVEVCDQLSGCISYEDNLTVMARGRRRLSTSDIILQEYIADTSNSELIPLYSIAYIETYNLTADDVAYIYNDFLSYIDSRDSITSEIIEIYLSFINKILYTVNTEYLTYDIIEMYLQEIINLVQNSTNQLTTDNMNIIYSISEQTLTLGNFTLNYIQLVNNVLNILVENYSLNVLPGTIIADIQVNNTLYYYKEREISLDYTNTSLLFNDGTEINNIKLSFGSESIINIIVAIYPQTNAFSSIININFTNSGAYINQTLNMTSEQALDLNGSTLQVLVPFNQNTSENWGCQSIENGSWSSNGCRVVEVLNSSVLIEVSVSSMFKLTEFSSSSSTPSSYIPIIMSGFLVFVLIFGYLIFYSKEKMKLLHQIETKPANQKVTRLYDILSYHTLYGLFINDPYLMKSERLVTYICILNSGLVIEGVFVVSSTFNNTNGWLVLIGFIASLCTLFFNIIINLVKRKFVTVKRLFVIIMFIIAIGDLAIVIIVTLLLGTHKNNQWIICFGWGLLFNIAIELLPAIIYSSIFSDVYLSKSLSNSENDSPGQERSGKNEPSVIVQDKERKGKKEFKSHPISEDESPREIDILHDSSDEENNDNEEENEKLKASIPEHKRDLKIGDRNESEGSEISR